MGIKCTICNADWRLADGDHGGDAHHALTRAQRRMPMPATVREGALSLIQSRDSVCLECVRWR